MSLSIVIRPEAEGDLAEGAIWYESQQPGLGSDFIEAVILAIEALPAAPRLVSRRHRQRDIRWVYSARFPYRVIYELAGNKILILGVLHAARGDSHWRERLSGE